MTSQSNPSHAAGGARWSGGRRVAVRRQEQLGVSSSEEQKTFHKASRWSTIASSERACCGDSTGTGGAQDSNSDRLHQTCRPDNQFEHVCVEECPLTTRHTAKRDSCGESHRALAGVHPGGRSRKPDHGKTQRRKLRERVSPERNTQVTIASTPVNPLENSSPKRERNGEVSDVK